MRRASGRTAWALMIAAIVPVLPAWSAGSHIVFLLRQDARAGAQASLAMVDPDGREKALRPDQPVPLVPAPYGSRDGTRVLISTGTDIGFVLLSGEGFQPIARLSAQFPRWSPDERRIAYVAYDMRDGIGTANIWLLDLQENTSRPLTDDGWMNDHPSWSPDGRQVAFTSQRDQSFWRKRGGNALPTNDIFVLDIESARLRNLTQSRAQELYPQWSPDGSAVLYLRVVDDSFHDLEALDIESGRTWSVTSKTLNVFYASWSPTGRQIVLAAAPVREFLRGEAGGNLYIAARDGRDVRRITDYAPGSWPYYPNWFGSSDQAVSPLAGSPSVWGRLKKEPPAERDSFRSVSSRRLRPSP